MCMKVRDEHTIIYVIYMKSGDPVCLFVQKCVVISLSVLSLRVMSAVVLIVVKVLLY